MPATSTRTEHAGPTPVAARLRAARRAQRLTLRAAVLGIEGISAATLCRVEKGERSLSGPVLLALGERLAISRDELADLSGGLTGEGLEELFASDIALCLRGGRLLPEAVQALRAVHLSQLARRRGGDSLDELSYALNLDFRASAGRPGFEANTAYYRLPRGAPAETSQMWQAHGLAHAILSDAGSSPRTCAPDQPTSPLEREATILARHLLLPTARLRSAHRSLGAPEPHDPRELLGLIAELAGVLKAPAGWIAVRLAEEGLLGIAA
jgi:transcriptional regulator with XRE-family HTH domain